MKLAITFEDLMIPCLWKKTFNIDCFGCGIQRSFLLVLKGEFSAAFYMYPAIYGLILMFLFLLVHLKFKIKDGHRILLGLFLINISIIVISYFIKHF